MFISFDIGASKTRIATFSKAGKMLDRLEYDTIKKYASGYKKLAENILILQNKNNVSVKFISGSIAAVCSKDGKKILSSTRLKDWVGKTLAKDLHTEFGVTTYLINDAMASGLGESVYGAGKNSQVVLYVTISTGINGACITNKMLNYPYYNFQFGHQIIQPNGKYWKYCGQRGCLESYASGLAFYEEFGIKPELCHNTDIWDKFSFNLAIGLINMIVMHSPEIVVIGGGLSKAGDVFLKPLKKHIKNNLKIFKIPIIKFSDFVDDSGLVGGLAISKKLLQKEKIFNC